MKNKHSIEKQLMAELPPMKSSTREKLRQQMLALAEHHFEERSSGFNSLFNNMKRYSIFYFAVLVLAVFVTTSFLPRGLTAPDVLAKVNDAYMPQTGIYHEKILKTVYDSGEIHAQTIEESYVEETAGNFLSFIKNPQTESIEVLALEHQDSYGDINIYHSDPLYIEKIESDSPMNPELVGPKLFCLQSFEQDYSIGQAVLSLAENDLSAYQVNGMTIDKRDAEELSLWELPRAMSNSKDFVEQLLIDEDYYYEIVDENGVQYYLFKTEYGDRGERVWFYVNSESFRLDRYEVYSETTPNVYESYTILESESIDSAQSHSIFDAERFEPLPLYHGKIAAFTASAFQDKADGCYDSEGQKLEDDFLEQVDDSIIREWNEAKDELMEELSGGDYDAFEDLETPLGWESFSLPSRGVFTAMFTDGHLGWDFSASRLEDIGVYAPFEGRVKQVSKGLWMSGYGNMVILSHEINGVEYETVYAQLEGINVVKGQTVAAGERIAEMGNSGRTTATMGRVMLHFEVRLNDEKIDPRLLWQTEN